MRNKIVVKFYIYIYLLRFWFFDFAHSYITRIVVLHVSANRLQFFLNFFGKRTKMFNELTYLFVTISRGYFIHL